VLLDYIRAGGPANDPIYQALVRLPGRLVTRTRRQLVPDGVWYRSAAFEYRRMNHVDHSLTSVYRLSGDDGAFSVISLERALGDRDFSQREQQLVRFFHAEIGPLIGHALVGATEPSPARLSLRLRETLACLLEGDSERQVAARLGLSPTTIHQYVTALYRHFQVRSRGQLLAHVIRRLRCRGGRSFG
jgi:DNA-binding CsgD family transcriptional regulator